MQPIVKPGKVALLFFILTVVASLYVFTNIQPQWTEQASTFNVYLNDNEYQSLQSQIELSSTKEMKSNWIEIAATKAYANKSNKDNIFYGALCKKSDKKF